MKKYLLVLVSLITVIIILFLTGSSVLTYNLFDIPFGNLLVWFGIISIQLFFYLLNRGYKNQTNTFTKIIRILAMFFLVIACLWFFVAYVIAGNVNFNFSGSSTQFIGSPAASILYWNIIYTLIISPIILAFLYKVFNSIKRRNLTHNEK